MPCAPIWRGGSSKIEGVRFLMSIFRRVPNLPIGCVYLAGAKRLRPTTRGVVSNGHPPLVWEAGPNENETGPPALSLCCEHKGNYIISNNMLLFGIFSLDKHRIERLYLG